MSGQRNKKEGCAVVSVPAVDFAPVWAEMEQNREKPHVLDEDALLGKREPLPGKKRLAVADIGTTTIAMLLYRQDGSVEERFAGVNPQTEYGADVLSRIRAAENQNVAEKLKEQVEGVLEKGISRFRKKLMPEEEMILVLAANTTMTYLLLGRNSRELGQAPFHASFLQGVETEISGVRVYVFPGMSAFVGEIFWQESVPAKWMYQRK